MATSEKQEIKDGGDKPQKSAAAESSTKSGKKKSTAAESPTTSGKKKSTAAESPAKSGKKKSTAAESPAKSGRKKSAAAKSSTKSGKKKSTAAESPAKSGEKRSTAAESPAKSEKKKSAASSSRSSKTRRKKSKSAPPAPKPAPVPSLQKPGGNGGENGKPNGASPAGSETAVGNKTPAKKNPAASSDRRPDRQSAGQGRKSKSAPKSGRTSGDSDRQSAGQERKSKSAPKSGRTSGDSDRQSAGQERKSKSAPKSDRASGDTGSKSTGKKRPSAKSGTSGRGKPSKRRRPEARRQEPEETVIKPPAPKAPPEPERPTELALPETITVRDMSEMMGMSPIDVIKELMNNGIMANINQVIDFDTAAIIAEELGFTVTEEKPPEVEKEDQEVTKTLRQILCETADPSQLKPRPPVVTVLGHVDHGKTTLLDAIRQTEIVETEAGGITQRIGAYQVDVNGRKITFIDTPGHEAFTAMRARGAQVTDLAVLVVAADDGVMPQTREAIDHARAAQVPILVALNKIDRDNANPDLLKQQLADLGLVVEDWGGDVICIPVSAKFQQGIEDLLENILLVTEVAELRANPDCPAIGTVVEGKLDKAKGVVTTVLVQNGTLRVGDALLVGAISGRVRAMFDDKGESVRETLPSMPVAVLGLSGVPAAGEVFEVVASGREARIRATERADAERVTVSQPVVKILSLEDIASQIKAGQAKELNIVLKADAQGSIEPIINSLKQLGDEDLHVKVLHTGTGNISESDIMLAAASHAVVVGFAVGPDNAARRLAEQEGVDIRLYEIIYTLLEDLDKALRGLLEPEFEDVVVGHAEVREVFRVSKVGKIAGCYITDGMATRDALVRVLRGEEELFNGTLQSLKRFAEDVKEVGFGYECGIGIDRFSDIEVGDVLEFYKKELVTV